MSARLRQTELTQEMMTNAIEGWRERAEAAEAARDALLTEVERLASDATLVAVEQALTNMLDLLESRNTYWTPSEEQRIVAARALIARYREGGSE